MVEAASKIEIFGDSPTIEDGLGFDDYANILLELIGNFDAESPLTIGIHGRWGSGKTSLMKMLEKRFKDDKNVKTVWFNAWAYGNEPIGLALLQQILNEFQKDEKLKDKGKNLIENVGKLGIDAFLRKTTTITLKEAEDLFKSRIEIKNTLRDDFKNVINECLQDRERLVVFIDDLDRCLPEKTIEILEVIKLFLDVPKCIFVIGVEKEVIKKGIEVRYKSKEQELPISGQDYIEKIIQIPFVLPPIREADMAAFIEKLGIGEREKGYVTIVAKYTGCNPRKVKLFLNVLRIRRAIAERTGGEIEPDLFAKLFVFEYVFLEFYENLVKYKDQDILCTLERLARGDSDEELEEELGSSELLKKYHENDDLSSLLRDEPLFCGIDIEPYIYLSGAEVSQEVTASGESVLDELLSGDYMKMSRAADAVNKMPDLEKQQSLNVVISKLKDEAANVCSNATAALGVIGDAGAVEALKEALEKGDANVRRNAAKALGRIGDAGAVEALEKALEKGDANVRSNAASALGVIGDAGAVEALEKALEKGDATVRRNAAKALGVIGDARAVEALIEALKDKDANVRGNAVSALGRIGDAGAVGVLKEVLKDKDEDANLRRNVAKALGRIGDPRAVGVLKEALNDMNANVCRNAAVALGRIGDPRAVEALKKALEDVRGVDRRVYAEKALKEIEAKQNQ
ncbi:MAG: hypothetical protein EF813_05290 [Methanosarcinales archaeon]|nr:MAG: hypothetical protein EF813_05290 [Methanosarcinales archaeon]